MDNEKYKCVDMSDDQFEKIFEASKRGVEMQKLCDDAIEFAKQNAPVDAYDFQVVKRDWDENTPGTARIQIRYSVPVKGWPLALWKMKQFYGKICNL